MKTEIRTKVTTSEYNVYIANDGTEFKDMEMCKKYDESALCAIKTRLDLKPISDENEEIRNALNALDSLIEDGSDVSDYFIWSPANEDEIKNLLQWISLEGCSISKPWLKENSYTYADKELKVGETYIVIYNNECPFFMITNYEKMSNSINNIFTALSKLK